MSEPPNPEKQPRESKSSEAEKRADRKYFLKHREQILAARRKRESTPEGHAHKMEIFNKWRAKNRDHVLEVARKWEKKNKVKRVAKTRRWRQNNRETYRAWWLPRWYKENYGLTFEDVQRMLREQDNKCGICKQEFIKTPHVDHDHETGENRQLLCNGCNPGIGKTKDSPARTWTLMLYALRFKKVPTIG